MLSNTGRKSGRIQSSECTFRSASLFPPFLSSLLLFSSSSSPFEAHTLFGCCSLATWCYRECAPPSTSTLYPALSIQPPILPLPSGPPSSTSRTGPTNSPSKSSTSPSRLFLSTEVSYLSRISFVASPFSEESNSLPTRPRSSLEESPRKISDEPLLRSVLWDQESRSSLFLGIAKL